MIRRAVLTWPAAGDPARSIAGFPVLFRQLLSLQDAGISEIWLDGPTGGERLVPRDPRLTMTVRMGPPPPGVPVLQARAGLLWHPSVPRRLAQSDASADLERAPLAAGEFVVATDTDERVREATRRLYRSLIKPTDGFIARNFDRHISIAVSRLLVDTGITPNQMTIAGTIIGIAAFVVVFIGGAAALVPGAILLMTQSVLDGCDGELSRLKYLRSRKGEWLDQVGDDIVNLGYFVAVGSALARAGSAIAAPVTWIGAVLHVVYQIALYTALVTRGGGSGNVNAVRWWGQEEGGAASRWPRLSQLVVDLGRRDFFVFLYLPCALLGWNELPLVWSGVIFAFSGVTTGLQWLVGGGPAPAVAPAAPTALTDRA
jgi:phosphatidylglycerophosphate synthase